MFPFKYFCEAWSRGKEAHHIATSHGYSPHSSPGTDPTTYTHENGNRLRISDSGDFFHHEKATKKNFSSNGAIELHRHLTKVHAPVTEDKEIKIKIKAKIKIPDGAKVVDESYVYRAKVDMPAHNHTQHRDMQVKKGDILHYRDSSDKSHMFHNDVGHEISIAHEHSPSHHFEKIG